MSTEEDSSIFTSVVYYRYEGPDGFCFDTNCKDPPIVTNKASPEFNVVDRSELLLAYMRQQVSHVTCCEVVSRGVTSCHVL